MISKSKLLKLCQYHVPKTINWKRLYSTLGSSVTLHLYIPVSSTFKLAKSNLRKVECLTNLVVFGKTSFSLNHLKFLE